MVKRKSEIISRFLTPAIKFWLRSQLETVEDLTIGIDAGDGKIIRGKIDQVSLQTTKAIYQGIHVSQASVKTEKIAINLGGILKGKPLRLLQPIFVEGEIVLGKNDLQTSLYSPLLKQGLRDLVSLLLAEEKTLNNHEQILANYEIEWQQMNIYPDKFMLEAILIDINLQEMPLVLTSNLALENHHTLSMSPIRIEGIPEMEMIILNEFTVDLGDDVEIKTLQLSAEQLLCQGKAKVVS